MLGPGVDHGRDADTRLLTGQASDLAVQSLRVLAPAQAVPQYPRLLALLPAQARVGEVNAALTYAGLRIDEMRPGNHALMLRMAAAGAGGTAGELDLAAQRLQATGVFDRVMRLAPAASLAGITQAAVGAQADDTDWGVEAMQCSD